MSTDSNSPRLEHIRLWIQALSTILIPIAILLVGNWYAVAMKSQETSAKFVELALKILTDTPRNENKSLRTWAISVLRTHSPTPVSDEVAKELNAGELAQECKAVTRTYTPPGGPTQKETVVYCRDEKLGWVTQDSIPKGK